MYEHYPVTGAAQKITSAEANKLVDDISTQWVNENTSLGKLFMGVYDWAYTMTDNEMKLHIPKLVDGGEIPLNPNATKVFGFDIYGDCFLEI